MRAEFLFCRPIYSLKMPGDIKQWRRAICCADWPYVMPCRCQEPLPACQVFWRRRLQQQSRRDLVPKWCQPMPLCVSQRLPFFAMDSQLKPSSSTVRLQRCAGWPCAINQRLCACPLRQFSLGITGAGLRWLQAASVLRTARSSLPASGFGLQQGALEGLGKGSEEMCWGHMDCSGC
jgi:hypothetical protein